MDIDIAPVNARLRAGNPQSMQKQRRMSGLMTKQENNNKYEFNAPRYDNEMLFEDDQAIDNSNQGEMHHEAVVNPRISNRMSFGMSKFLINQ